MKNISEQFYNNNVTTDDKTCLYTLTLINKAIKYWREPTKNELANCEEIIMWGIMFGSFDSCRSYNDLKIIGKVLRDGHWISKTMPIMAMSKVDSGTLYITAFDDEGLLLFRLRYSSSLESALNTINTQIECDNAAIRYSDLLDIIEDSSCLPA